MGPTYPIYELDLTLDQSYVYTKFCVNEIATSSVHTYIHTHTHTRTYIQTYTHAYRKSLQPQDLWRNMTSMSLRLFVNKLQPKLF